MSATLQGRLAVLSDIHGNRWALESVLEDIDRRGIRSIVNLGDSLYGPLDPVGTADILLPLNLPTVRGNEDRLISEASGDSATVRFVCGQLDKAHIDWLEGLPLTTVVFDELLLCHGTPDRDDEYLLQVVSKSGARPRTPGELSEALRGVTAPVVLCGHDHVPSVVSLPDDALPTIPRDVYAKGALDALPTVPRVVVNPGSVGLPAYVDDVPYRHAMETESPHARYALLSRTAGGWQTESIAVTYDHAAAAEAAEKNGREDWSAWLRTGRAEAPGR